jgi:hypothetical protein
VHLSAGRRKAGNTPDWGRRPADGRLTDSADGGESAKPRQTLLKSAEPRERLLARQLL